MLPTQHSTDAPNDFHNNPADSPVAREKIEQDIAFLHDKLTAMKMQPKPNRLLIDHYSGMLKSRESVLKWLTSLSDNASNSLPHTKHSA
jgi:hypothetical protein